MAWNQYIDSVINFSLDTNKSPHVDGVAVVGLDGTLWTTKEHASHFALSPDECLAISNAFKSNKTDAFSEHGIVAKGVKYMFLNADTNETSGEVTFIRGKKKEQGSICICKCLTCFIVAHSAEGMQAGSANKAADDTRKYLAEQNC